MNKNLEKHIGIQQIGTKDYLGYIFPGTEKEQIVAREKTEALCRNCTLARLQFYIEKNDITI